MKKRNFLLLGILITIIILSVLNIFTGIFNRYTLFVFILLTIGVAVWGFGFPKHKNMIEKDVILSIIAYIILYYLVIYIIGYFIGFTRSIYSTNLKMIIKNTFPIIITIPACEVLRYIINTRTRENKLLILLSYIAFTLISSTIYIRGLVVYSNLDTETIIRELALFVIPTITTNMLLTYLSIKVGYKTGIIYRYLIELPVYIIPIVPKFGEYIDAVIKLSIPIIILLWLYRKIDKSTIKKIVVIEKKKLLNIYKLIAIIICMILVYFICGLFRLHAIVIASGSMTPKINVGDIVIVDKKDNKTTEYEIGEVITYESNNVYICHRITNVIKAGKTVLYETKGDNNNDVDQILVKQDQVLGRVRFKIKYLGYPTVLLNKYRET